MINSAYPKTDCLGSESSRLSEKHSDPWAVADDWSELPVLRSEPGEQCSYEFKQCLQIVRDMSLSVPQARKRVEQLSEATASITRPTCPNPARSPVWCVEK